MFWNSRFSLEIRAFLENRIFCLEIRVISRIGRSPGIRRHSPEFRRPLPGPAGGRPGKAETKSHGGRPQPPGVEAGGQRAHRPAGRAVAGGNSTSASPPVSGASHMCISRVSQTF